MNTAIERTSEKNGEDIGLTYYLHEIKFIDTKIQTQKSRPRAAKSCILWSETRLTNHD